MEIFNTKRVYIENKPMTIDHILRLYDKGKIDKQNLYVDWEYPSYIESLWLGIDNNHILMSLGYQEDGIYRIENGDYKIATILKFVKDGMKLEGMQYYTELEGMTIDQIPALKYNMLMEHVFDVKIISPSNKYEITNNLIHRFDF